MKQITKILGLFTFLVIFSLPLVAGAQDPGSGMNSDSGSGLGKSVDVNQKYDSGDNTTTKILYTAMVAGQTGTSAYTYTWTRVDSGYSENLKTSNNPSLVFTVPGISGIVQVKLDVTDSSGNPVGTKTVNSDLAVLRNAASSGGNNAGSGSGTGSGGSGSNAGCTFDSNGTQLCNPIKSNNLTELLIVLLKGFLAFSALAAVGMIVVGGLRMMISQGNENDIKTAKKTITWAVIGLVIALLSYSIVSIVVNLLKGNV